MDEKQTQRSTTRSRTRLKGSIQLRAVKQIKLPFVPPRAEKEEKSFVLGYN